MDSGSALTLVGGCIVPVVYMWITAPGEAEATLSEMSSIGVPVSVDAILTDDSDSFVFGAGVVLRIRSEDNESYSASRYSAFDIAQGIIRMASCNVESERR
ncbi:PIN domain-like protein [Mycena sanguinolenta]|uniref:PIN domain-like protein n=1 Tax=Mycena sanguinolenta TaxID=230812 RepID=A0A8H6ZMI6_9AGAR|nr:PIN domain-like protein [Mycena sanguinolenta]